MKRAVTEMGRQKHRKDKQAGKDDDFVDGDAYMLHCGE